MVTAGLNLVMELVMVRYFDLNAVQDIEEKGLLLCYASRMANGLSSSQNA